MILKKGNIRAFKRNRKRSSLAQIPTPIIPITNVIIVRIMVKAASLRKPIIPPTTSAALNNIINQTLMFIPSPPKDQALEYNATIATKMVIIIISITKPHSKVFVRNS